MTEILAGIVAVIVAVVGAYMKGRRDSRTKRRGEDALRYEDTRKDMDDVQDHDDPDAARDAMRVRRDDTR